MTDDSAGIPLSTIEKRDSTNLFPLLLEHGDEETFSQLCAQNRDRLDKDTEQFEFTYLQLSCLYLSKPPEWLSINSEDPGRTGHRERSYPIIHRYSKNRDQFDEDTGQLKLTYLQLACLRGLPNAVEALLTNGADPNRTAYPPDQSTPIMIAAQQGYYDIVKMLAQHEKIDYKTNCAVTSTLLHLLLDGMRLEQDCSGSHFVMEECISCIKLLLEKRALTLEDINAPDAQGFTALHRALQLQEKSLVLFLLEHGAYIGSRCYEGDAAVSLMNVDVFEEYLNNCIRTNDKKPIDKDYQIIYDYNILNIPRTYCNEPQIGSVSQTELLIEISCVPELRRLLKHPVLASFLHVKWYTLRKYFWINFIFYLTFWLCLTLHTLVLHSLNDGDIVQQLCINKTKECCEKIPAACCTPVACCRESQSITCQVACWTWYLSVFLCGLLSLREIFKYSVLPYLYVSDMENVLDIAVLILNLFVLFDEKRAEVAAFALLLTWTKMVLLIHRHHLPSSNIEMYKKVCISFMKLLAWWSMLLVAFALSFYLLFKDITNPDGTRKNHTIGENKNQMVQGNLTCNLTEHQIGTLENNQTENNDCKGKKDNIPKFFEKMETSFFKVILMMTGEFEASTIPFNSYPGVSHSIFILFVFLVSIVLFNLMNGLAVSDTQAIINDAKIVGYATLAKQIAPLERMVITILNFLTIFPIEKERLIDSILFPHELFRVFVLPNQSSPDGRKAQSFHSILDYDKYTSRTIASEIINETKKILQEQKSKREENERSSNSLDRYSEELKKYSDELKRYSEELHQEYAKRLALLEETTNEKLNNVNEKLNKVIKLLGQRH